MHTRQERALTLFREGFACSQAVLACYTDAYGLDTATAMKLACGFGGGVKCGEVCGAASGAVMVVGLKHGQKDPADREARKICSINTTAFINAFKERCGGLTCRELLGCDITTQEGLQHARDAKLFSTICVDFVATTIAILEEQGY